MALDRLLVEVYPVLLAALLAAWGAAAWACAKTARRELASVLGMRGFAAAAALFGLALAGRLALPAGHRVYFDEYEHVDIASHVASSGDLAECDASAPGLDMLEPSTWPGLFHVALGAVFAATGASERTAYRFNAFFGAAGAAVLVLAAALMFGDAPGALTAGAFAAALPTAVIYSTGADLTAFSCFWLALALLAMELCVRRPGRRTFLLLLLTLLCAAHARFENALLIPVAAFRLSRSDAWREALAPAESRLALGAAAAGLLPLAALVWRDRAAGIPGFGDPAGAALTHLAADLPADLRWLLAWPWFWLLAAPALAAAAFRPSRSEKAALWPLAACSAGYLVVYACFFRGDFSHGTEDRYAVSVLMPLFAAAACGVKRLPLSARGRRAAAAGAALLFVGLSWPRYAPRLEPAHQAEDILLHGPVAALPPGTWTAAFSAPAVASTAGRPVVSIAALEEDWPAWRRRLAGAPVALLEDFWWAKRPAQAAEAERLLSQGRDERITASIDAGPGLVYRLALFSPRRSLAEGPRAR